jgi:hypothetical protein
MTLTQTHWMFALKGDVLGYYGRSFKNDRSESIKNSMKKDTDSPRTDDESKEKVKFVNSLPQGKGWG